MQTVIMPDVCATKLRKMSYFLLETGLCFDLVSKKRTPYCQGFRTF